jgi:hypothetical protein
MKAVVPRILTLCVVASVISVMHESRLSEFDALLDMHQAHGTETPMVTKMVKLSFGFTDHLRHIAVFDVFVL